MITRTINGRKVTDTAEAWVEFDLNEQVQQARTMLSDVRFTVATDDVSLNGAVLIEDSLRLLALEAEELRELYALCALCVAQDIVDQDTAP